MYCSKIVGTGSFLPARIVGNEEAARLLHLRDNEVFRVTGIRARRWAWEDEECSHLAEQAARQALESSGLDVSSIDAILVSTTSSDTIFPSTACHLQRRLGGRGVAAFDLAASCSGFLYGLSMADCFIRSGQFCRCLVVAAEVKSRYLNPGDAETAILFGDGAGAAVVERDRWSDSHPTGILAVRLHSDGAYHDLVEVPAGGSRIPTSPETIRDQLHAIHLRGGSLFRIAVKRLSVAVKDLLAECHCQVSDLEQVICHQANGRMLAAIANRLQILPDKMYSVIEEYGNASSASLPIALDCANRHGKIPSGSLILLGAFGGGLTWGTALIRWG